jgi:uncharacterized membrane protein YedE/YeeE
VKDRVGIVAVGLAFGYALARIGFSSWDEVHAMFTFASLRLLLTFMTAVAVLVVAWIVVRRFSSPRWTARPVHPGTLAGGAIFGAGWAISGACPSIAWVQIGEGQLGAIFTLVGIVAGNYLYSIAHERWFRWSAGTCVDD